MKLPQHISSTFSHQCVPNSNFEQISNSLIVNICCLVGYVISIMSLFYAWHVVVKYVSTHVFITIINKRLTVLTDVFKHAPGSHYYTRQMKYKEVVKYYTWSLGYGFWQEMLGLFLYKRDFKIQ